MAIACVLLFRGLLKPVPSAPTGATLVEGESLPRPRVDFEYDAQSYAIVVRWELCVGAITGAACRQTMPTIVPSDEVYRKPPAGSITLAFRLTPSELKIVNAGGILAIRACNRDNVCAVRTTDGEDCKPELAATCAPNTWIEEPPTVSKVVSRSVRLDDADRSVRISLRRSPRDLLICVGSKCGIPEEWALWTR